MKISASGAVKFGLIIRLVGQAKWKVMVVLCGVGVSGSTGGFVFQMVAVLFDSFLLQRVRCDSRRWACLEEAR